MVLPRRQYRCPLNGVSGIYEILNTVDGMVYVGSAVSIGARFSRHKTALRGGTHHCSHLQRAWDKYGEASFAFSVLQVVENVGSLIEHEQAWIARKNSANHEFGYNSAPIAGSLLGFKFSQESRLAKARSMTGKKYTAERCANMAAAMRGKRHSLESRAKMSLARKGLKRDPDAVRRMAITQKGSVRPSIRGENSPTAKLTEVVVRKIRSLYENGSRNYSALGRMFGVSDYAIRCVIFRKTWGFVTP